MRFRVKGLKEYLTKLEKLSNYFAMKYAAELALQKGADVVADETRSAISGIPVDNRPYVPDGRKSIMQVQKNGLLEGFGISPKQEKGDSIDMKTGVDGYNKIGQPNVLIARILESGTSYMPSNPVISKATRRARKKCVQAIEDSLNESIEKMMR